MDGRDVGHTVENDLSSILLLEFVSRNSHIAHMRRRSIMRCYCKKLDICEFDLWSMCVSGDRI